MTDSLMTPTDVAAILVVPVDTLRVWRYRGEGPPYLKVNGRMVRYRQSAVTAWLRQQEVTTDGAA